MVSDHNRKHNGTAVPLEMFYYLSWNVNDMLHTVNISKSQKLYYWHGTRSLQSLFGLHSEVTVCTTLRFYNLFYSNYPVIASFHYFKNSVVYSTGFSLKVYFSCIFLCAHIPHIEVFYNVGIRFSVAALNPCHISKIEIPQ
jgi:hypothetical protein